GRPEAGPPLWAGWAPRFLLGGGFILLVLVAAERSHLQGPGYGLALAGTGTAAFAGTLAAPVLARRWRPQALLQLAFLPPGVAALLAGYAPTLPRLLGALAPRATSFQVLKGLTDAVFGRSPWD